MLLVFKFVLPLCFLTSAAWCLARSGRGFRFVPIGEGSTRRITDPYYIEFLLGRLKRDMPSLFPSTTRRAVGGRYAAPEDYQEFILGKRSADDRRPVVVQRNGEYFLCADGDDDPDAKRASSPSLGSPDVDYGEFLFGKRSPTRCWRLAVDRADTDADGDALLGQRSNSRPDKRSPEYEDSLVGKRRRPDYRMFLTGKRSSPFDGRPAGGDRGQVSDPDDFDVDDRSMPQYIDFVIGRNRGESVRKRRSVPESGSSNGTSGNGEDPDGARHAYVATRNWNQPRDVDDVPRRGYFSFRDFLFGHKRIPEYGQFILGKKSGRDFIEAVTRRTRRLREIRNGQRPGTSSNFARSEGNGPDYGAFLMGKKDAPDYSAFLMGKKPDPDYEAFVFGKRSTPDRAEVGANVGPDSDGFPTEKKDKPDFESFFMGKKMRPDYQNFLMGKKNTPDYEKFLMGKKDTPDYEKFLMGKKAAPAYEQFLLGKKDVPDYESFLMGKKDTPSYEQFLLGKKNAPDYEKFLMGKKDAPDYEKFLMGKKAAPSYEQFLLGKKDMPDYESFLMGKKNTPSYEHFLLGKRGAPDYERFLMGKKDTPVYEQFLLGKKDSPDYEKFLMGKKEKPSYEEFLLGKKDAPDYEKFLMGKKDGSNYETFLLGKKNGLGYDAFLSEKTGGAPSEDKLSAEHSSSGRSQSSAADDSPTPPEYSGSEKTDQSD